ncbi:molybdopterin molybdotransferase MoeA [Devosia sp. YIM 151766]|uniref:molybdopterin molybdotransferase MoeA n=1 Tax=Devosia sp. YIM 151766 TaxID=3017325 RepID=UPI00255CEF8A|nr:gephyrin-like molybdotransferase Glp [Devosia sp. YIM 151766]WIY54308.1 molybdopterin molybdotransferase MoeA [Devosia sp. YIM 151766]
MSLLPVEQARAAILARVPPVTPEEVALAEAVGRVLAAPLIAAHDQPPFAASAMDGYAMRAADVTSAANLRVIGMSQAGAGFAGAVGAGEAVRIFTGAPVPPGADTVIMQEEAVRDGDTVRFTAPARPGHSVRPKGHDFATGDILIEAGSRLTPMQIAVAAAANQAGLTVARRPRIGLVATGDELVLPGTPLGPDQIVASNSVGLAAMLAPYAETITDHGIIGDDAGRLRQSLADAFDAGPDILITTGGASVGEHDLVQDALKSLGVTLDFWRINMRPGKPLMFGTHGKTLVFGLPGNPVSAMVTAIVFIKPALRAWLGYREPEHWRLPLAGPTPPNSARRHFMRARLRQTGTGPQIMPVSQTDSGHTSSLAYADMLIIQPEHDPGEQEGAMVAALPIDAF